jgi:hypothetical protein
MEQLLWFAVTIFLLIFITIFFPAIIFSISCFIDWYCKHYRKD